MDMPTSQWRNNRGGGGAGRRVPPWHFSPGKFCWHTGKREARKKGRLEKKRRKKIGKGKEENLQNEEKTKTFFFFFLIAFHFSKTTEICFGSSKMGIFNREKAFHAGKKSGKTNLPLWKIFLLRPCSNCIVRCDSRPTETVKVCPHCILQTRFDCASLS